jgi:hypothetical protein
MSHEAALESVGRTRPLIRLILLAVASVAILAAACSVLLPYAPEWAETRLMVMFTVGCSLALFCYWVVRTSASQSWLVDPVAMALGIVALVLAISAVFLSGHAAGVTFSDPRKSPESRVYGVITAAASMRIMRLTLVSTVCSVLGLLLARRRARATRRASMVGAAVRFSTTGLVLAALLFATFLLATAYRWLVWV